MSSLKIVAAENTPSQLEALDKELTGLGHEVVAHCTTGEELSVACRHYNPAMVITGVGITCLNGDLFDVIHDLYEYRPVPVIVVTEDDTHDEAIALSAKAITAHLIRPIPILMMSACINHSVLRFELYILNLREIDDLRATLKERKLIEQAKGVLMKRTRMTEDEAHKHLQTLAVRRNIKLGQMASLVIAAETEFARVVNNTTNHNHNKNNK